MITIAIVAIVYSFTSKLFGTPWTAAWQASLSFAVSQSSSNSCPLSRWCHPTITSSVVPFSSGISQWSGSWHHVATVLELSYHPRKQSPRRSSPSPPTTRLPLRSLSWTLRGFLTLEVICDSFLSFSLCPLPPDPCHQCLAHSRCSIRLWWVSTFKRVMHQALGLDFIWVFPYLSLPTDWKSLSHPLFTSVDADFLSTPRTPWQWMPNDCLSPHLSFKNQNLNTLEPAQRTRSLLRN